MASESSEKKCSLCEKIGLKPLTKENLFKTYAGLYGVANYALLSVNIMNPQLLTKTLGIRDATNILLLSSIAGTACYVYNRPHLQKVPSGKRAVYAALGSSLWAMGSILGWAVLKSLLNRNNDSNALAAIAGLCSGAIVVKITNDYIHDNDSLVSTK